MRCSVWFVWVTRNIAVHSTYTRMHRQCGGFRFLVVVWIFVRDSVRLEGLNSNLMPNESHTFAERSSGTRRLVNRWQHVVGVAMKQQHIKGPPPFARRQGGLRASVDRLKTIMPIEMHASRRRPQEQQIGSCGIARARAFQFYILFLLNCTRL